MLDMQVVSPKLILGDGYKVWNQCSPNICLEHLLFVLGFSSGRGGICWTYLSPYLIFN